MPVSLPFPSFIRWVHSGDLLFHTHGVISTRQGRLMQPNVAISPSSDGVIVTMLSVFLRIFRLASRIEKHEKEVPTKG